MKIFFYSFIIACFLFLITNSCKKKEDSAYSAISVTHIIKNVSAIGGSDGSVTLKVSGGVTPYSFFWSNGATTKDITGLKAGTYICIVTDAVKQTKIDTSIILEPTPILVSHVSTNVSFKGGKDGTITLTVSGGITPYKFSWSNGDTTENITGLKAGKYTCTVKDAVNQVKTDSATITEPDKYEIIKVTTDSGIMYYWLYNQTPGHKKNFLTLTASKFYDSLLFHRIVLNFVIQGGDPTGTGNGGPGYDIPAEFNDSLTHVYGAIGAARLPDAQNPQKKSNGSQYYIVVNTAGEHSLDHNYTVFGIVIGGMNVAMAISKVPVNTANNDRPLTNIYMKKVEIVYYSASDLLSTFGFKIPEFN